MFITYRGTLLTQWVEHVTQSWVVTSSLLLGMELTFKIL